MESAVALGVRKGGWAAEEDDLLRKCIQVHGEGKWHLVPLRAGLNRCRKSCRLRWLNYLRPNINREDFASDEVDLIIRLHKLLGNRWSLIAGRLPGRTANHVKNYYNTHLQKILMAQRKEVTVKDQKITTGTIIKPQPRRFRSRDFDLITPSLTLTTTIANGSNVLEWWDNLVDVDKDIGETVTSFVGVFDDQQPITGFWTNEISRTSKEENEIFVQGEGQKGWSDLSMDVDIWNLFYFDQLDLM